MASLNGCHNLPRPVAGAITHFAQAGWTGVNWGESGKLTREQVVVPIRHVMTTACQYTKTTPDPRCAGCVHEKRTRVRSNKPLNLVGQRFGILTVTALASKPEGGQGQHWSCTCDCGAVTVKRGKDLNNGNTASCGCLKSGKGQGGSTGKGWRKGKPSLNVARPWRKGD